jgi:hypothetical protein
MKLKQQQQKKYTLLRLCSLDFWQRCQRNSKREKNSRFEQRIWGQLIPQCKKVKLDLCLMLYRKVTSKWFTNLNVKARSIELLEENIEVNLCDLGLVYSFLDITQKAQGTVKNSWFAQKLKTLALQGH